MLEVKSIDGHAAALPRVIHILDLIFGMWKDLVCKNSSMPTEPRSRPMPDIL